MFLKILFLNVLFLALRQAQLISILVYLKLSHVFWSQTTQIMEVIFR